jgi:hypothetical protein
VILVDTQRPELHTADTADHRSVPVQFWYPAESGTGAPTEYVDELQTISGGLIDSGALGGIEVAALSLVRTGALEGAAVAAGRHPVIVSLAR